MGDMHVLYLIDSLQHGGAEQSLATIAPHLVERGIRLEVAYFFERPGVADQLADAGVPLWSLAGHGGRRDRLRRCEALFDERRPDLVHTTLFEADLAGRIAARRAHVPVVSTLVSTRYGREHRENPAVRHSRMRVVQGLDMLTARLVRRFHAVSEVVAITMSRRLLVPRRRIDVVHRGRDPQELGRRTPERRARARAALDVRDDKVLALAVARHHHGKGLDTLIEAMRLVSASLPEVVVAVAGGEGGATGQLQALIRRHGLEETVKLLGARDDVAELMCGADVLAFPSRREGLPGVLIEAMALELPIVASDIPPNREVVGTGTSAALVPPGDPAALAHAIIETVIGPPDTRPLRQRFEDHFTIDVAADAMVRFYESSLGD